MKRRYSGACAFRQVVSPAPRTRDRRTPGNRRGLTFQPRPRSVGRARLPALTVLPNNSSLETCCELERLNGKSEKHAKGWDKVFEPWSLRATPAPPYLLEKRPLAAAVWIEDVGRWRHVRWTGQLRCPDRLTLQPHPLGLRFRLGIHWRTQPGEHLLEGIHRKHPTPADLMPSARALSGAGYRA